MSATVDKSEARVRQMFGEISERYDLMNHVLSGGVDYYWRWRTIRAVAPQGDAPILDVCTGTGDLALAYWHAGDGRVPVVATDFTPEMLRLAERKRDRSIGGRIANGAEATVDRENDKPTVIALREIAAGHVGPEILDEVDRPPTPELSAMDMMMPDDFRAPHLGLKGGLDDDFGDDFAEGFKQEFKDDSQTQQAESEDAE